MTNNNNSDNNSGDNNKHATQGVVDIRQEPLGVRRTGFEFAHAAAVAAAGEIDRAAADGGIDERIRRHPVGAFPRFDECILKHVLGVRLGASLLARVEVKARAAASQPCAPFVGRGFVMHRRADMLSPEEAVPFDFFVSKFFGAVTRRR